MYDWTIMDRIFDTWHAAKLRPLVEIGFMPAALSTATGWAYPPNDYQAWAELIFKWVRHEVERYGGVAALPVAATRNRRQSCDQRCCSEKSESFQKLTLSTSELRGPVAVMHINRSGLLSVPSP